MTVLNHYQTKYLMNNHFYLIIISICIKKIEYKKLNIKINQNLI